MGNRSYTYIGDIMKSQSNVNCDFFINCNTPESAYLLGFLWGDGNIYKYNFTEHRVGKRKTSKYNKSSYRISTECIESDLSEIKHLFNLSGRWTESRRHREGRSPSLTLSTTNKKFYDFLVKGNYGNKSGGHPDILKSIPVELIHYWWRGYFDADGCIYKIKNSNNIQISLTSTYDQDWSAVSNLLGLLEIKHSITRIVRESGNQYSYIRFTSKKSTKAFLDYIYIGKEFGLSRKRDIYSKLNTSSSDNAITLTPSITP